jgi:hypothetical protein
MPNRYIRESAIESEAVNSLGWQAEVFYRRLLNKVDDFGRYSASPSLLRAALFPLQLDKLREAVIVNLLIECKAAGLVFTYENGGKQFLVVNKWEQGRAKESKYPEPDANICEQMKTYVYGRSQMLPTPTPTPIPNSDTDSDSETETLLPSKGGQAPAESPDAQKPDPVKSALQLRAESLLKRRASTPFSPKELAAWKRALPAIQATTEEDWAYLEAYYALPQADTFSRKSIERLLNNWSGEIDRARGYRRKGSTRDLVEAAQIEAALKYQPGM